MDFIQGAVIAGCVGVGVLVYRRVAGGTGDGGARAAREAEALGLLPASRQNTLLPGPDPALQGALAAAARGNGEPAARLMAATRERRDWQRRSRYAARLAEAAVEGDGGWLDAWEAAAGPDDPDVAVVRVEFTIQLAGALRGSDWAKNTTDEQFAGFFRVLPQAVERIQRAAELNPGDPTPYISEMAVARGLNYPHGDVRRIWKTITRLDPYNYPAHIVALPYWYARWHGSDELAASFSREASEQAPPGTLLRMLPLIVWWDHRDDGAKEADFRTPELVAMVDAALVDAAAAPTDHPDLPRTRHLLAYFLARQGRWEAALELFRLVDGHVGAAPWSQYDFPAVAYCQWRDRAVRHAGRR
ncbi:hypothetical protein [Streptomyces sp. CC77]|uniref:hypothetical protein n=2 Tax=unclassified Streptomyces TaxID=2593676 RepID=UPI0008DC826D|nr:hypothetical protein [Streptomyces sp. CC77]OII68651.1 hypothetical protein BJP39_20605 [Streptomyces sp. CC77]